MTTMKLEENFLKLLITLTLEVMEGTHQFNLKEKVCKGKNVFYFIFKLFGGAQHLLIIAYLEFMEYVLRPKNNIFPGEDDDEMESTLKEKKVKESVRIFCHFKL